MPRSNWAREPQLLSLRVWSLCSATREAAIVRGPRTAMKSGPRSPELEKALAQKRKPNTPKKKKKKSTLTDEKGKKAMLRDRAVEATSQGVEMEEINKQRKVVLKLKSHGSETK